MIPFCVLCLTGLSQWAHLCYLAESHVRGALLLCGLQRPETLQRLCARFGNNLRLSRMPFSWEGMGTVVSRFVDQRVRNGSPSKGSSSFIGTMKGFQNESLERIHFPLFGIRSQVSWHLLMRRKQKSGPWFDKVGLQLFMAPSHGISSIKASFVLPCTLARGLVLCILVHPWTLRTILPIAEPSTWLLAGNHQSPFSFTMDFASNISYVPAASVLWNPGKYIT